MNMDREQLNQSTSPSPPAFSPYPSNPASPAQEEDIEMGDDYNEEVNSLSNINLDDPVAPGPAPSPTNEVNLHDGIIKQNYIAPNNNTPSQKDKGKNKNINTMSRSDINHNCILTDSNFDNQTNEQLIEMFQAKIVRLHMEQLEMNNSKDVDEHEKLITSFTNSIYKIKGIDQPNDRVNKGNKVKANGKKNINVPYFQLIDDPAVSKVDNKPSYENAESFVTAFENILSANEIDIHNDWNKYLAPSFVYCKYTKYVNFYNNRISPIKEKTNWNTIKAKIIDRFGASNNAIKNITNFLNIHQGKIETIRDYMDRYLDCGNKIPDTAKSDTQVDAMKFIQSLQLGTSEEITKILKRNKAPNKESYVPGSLAELFSFIETNIGEIQEALYISVKVTPDVNNNNKRERNNQSSAADDKQYVNKDKKQKVNNNDNNTDSDKEKKFCTFCKKVPFSFDHLNKCLPYLMSDTYQKYIIRNHEKKNNHQQKKVIPIYFSKCEKIKTDFNIDMFSDTYDQIDNEITMTFKEIGEHLQFDPVKYHKKFTQCNDHNVTNKDITLFKNNPEQIKCYLVDGYTEKEFENLSPYSPFIVVNKERLVSMLDTGSSISLINKTYDFEDKSIFENVTPANGTLSFVSKGQQSSRIGQTKPLEVLYRGRRPFNHKFEIVEMKDNSIPILLGRDITHKLGIRVENVAHSFEDVEQITYDDSVDNETYIPNVTLACSEKEYTEFMKYMEPYIKDNQSINIHELCPLKEAKVYLRTKPNEFAFARQYPIAYSLQGVVRDQIKKWLDDKTIEPAAPSGFNSPLTLVPKPNGKDGSKKWRICLDTRRINNLLENVSNVNTPLIEDIFHSVRESAVYSVFDITGAFHRLEINEADRHKLTFTFDGQSYQFRGSPFGIKSLSGIFQNVMQTIFADMQDFTCIYIDDLICHSKDMESHKRHCQLVIEALTKNKLPINIEKTYLARNSVYLLGFQISKEGKSIDIRRLTNIDEWVKPTTPKAMMKFCGLVSYLRTHLPKASALTAPLDHLRYSTKKTLEWTDLMNQSYDSIIEIIKSNIKLSHPDLNHEFSLACDASNYAVSCCLFQEFEDKESGKKVIKYIGFASKALTKSQRSYSVTKKELYALITGLNKFHKFLYGSKSFRCYTDHRSLQYLLTTKHMSMMMLRYMEVILTFPNMKIIWIPGIENVMSDKLSRLFPTSQDNISFEKDEKALFPHLFQKDKKVKKDKKRITKQKTNKKVHAKFTKGGQAVNNVLQHPSLADMPDFSTFYCDINNNDHKNDKETHHNYVRTRTWSIKTVHDLLDEQLDKSDHSDNFQIYYTQKMDESYVIPPEEDRKEILQNAHNFGHYGSEAIVQRIRKDEGMNWPYIIKDALEIVKQCATCQKFMIARRGYNPLKPLYCYTPGWHYQMDLCGPFPVTSSKNTYILVLLDVATRFVVLRAIPDKSAKTVSKTLISIFSLVGYPRQLHSDQGGEWKNAILDSLCEAMKIDKRLSTPYFASSNGGAERMVQNTKRLLAKLIQGVSEDDWDIVLDTVQIMINCKVNKRLNTSSFNLMFARKMSNEYPLFAHPDDKIEPMSNEELLKRIEYMSDIVFPAIKERTEIYNQMMKNQFDKSHRLVTFPVGSFVVVKKKGIQKSLAAPFSGPFEVVRKTKQGNYTLRDEMGLLMPRDFTPSELQIVSQDAVISKEEVYEFDAIVTHRGEPGKREYLIRWKNYSPEHDSWIPLKNFTDPQAVVKYWKRVKGAVPKDETSVLEKMLTQAKSDLPEFNINQQGTLLEQIDEKITDVDDNSSHSTRKTTPRRYNKQSQRTKPVDNNPIIKSFRKSPRSNKPTVSVANDKTRYKK